MRVEIDWMIHCKKLEQRLNTNQICSSKEEIIERVRNIIGLKTPVVVQLKVAAQENKFRWNLYYFFVAMYTVEFFG